MPFPPSAGRDLPLSEENSDLSILSVRDSSSGHEIEQTPVATGFQAHLFESKLDTLTNSMLKMSDSLTRLAPPHEAFLDSEEDVLSEETNLESGELPYEDLFKNTEDCGPKVNEGVAKRVNSACTKRPAKEQFSSIQKKYLRPENCDFVKAPRVNPELWDDLQDKTKSRECSRRI